MTSSVKKPALKKTLYEFVWCDDASHLVEKDFCEAWFSTNLSSNPYLFEHCDALWTSFL
jgi:hypothetical protein